MKKIDLMIIGAQKAGTSSLKNYLSEHPDITMHLTEELAFFQSNAEYIKGFKAIWNKNYPRGKSEIIAAKNAGLYEKETYLRRLKEHNPDCKIIFLIRNPVDRAFSSYLMEKREGFIDFDSSYLLNIIDSEDPINKNYFRKFIGLGMYANHLKVVYSIFPKENVLVFTFEDLKTDAQQVCTEILRKLNINPDIKIRNDKVYNQRKIIRSRKVARLLHHFKRENNPIKSLSKRILPYSWFLWVSNQIKSINYTSHVQEYEEMSHHTKLTLHKFYEPYNSELSQIIGRPLDHWNRVLR